MRSIDRAPDVVTSTRQATPSTQAWRTLACTLVLLAVASGCSAPAKREPPAAGSGAAAGDATIEPADGVSHADRTVLLDVPRGERINWMCATPDEKFVVGLFGSGALMAFSVDGALRGRTRGVRCDRVATGQSPDEILAWNHTELLVLGVPDFKVRRTLPMPQNSSIALVARRSGVSAGWIGADFGYHAGAIPSHIDVLTSDPFRVERSIELPFAQVTALGGDAGGETVVVAGDMGRLAIVDLITGAITTRRLPEPPGVHLAVVSGRSWVATRDSSGAFWEVPIAGGDPTVRSAGAPGSLYLVGDDEADLLGVGVTGDDRAGVRVTCALYAVESRDLRVIGSETHTFTHGIGELVLLPKSRALAFGKVRGEARIVTFR